jgi:hypothetical protein
MFKRSELLEVSKDLLVKWSFLDDVVITPELFIIRQVLIL